MGGIPILQKRGQRLAFFAYVLEHFRLEYFQAKQELSEWVQANETHKRQLRKVKRFISDGKDSTDFLQDDKLLYDFCESKGQRPTSGELSGITPVDAIGNFVLANGNRFADRIRHSGVYEIVRKGSNEIRRGEPIADHPQRYMLRIDNMGRDSPHAQFTYEDVQEANIGKPEKNKFHWSGNVVATHDALYLIGVSFGKSDAAMFIFWPHPEQDRILVGLQLAKLGGDLTYPDDYAIARPMAAIKITSGPIPRTIRDSANKWINDCQDGAVVSILKPIAPSTNTD